MREDGAAAPAGALPDAASRSASWPGPGVGRRRPSGAGEVEPVEHSQRRRRAVQRVEVQPGRARGQELPAQLRGHLDAQRGHRSRIVGDCVASAGIAEAVVPRFAKQDVVADTANQDVVPFAAVDQIGQIAAAGKAAGVFSADPATAGAYQAIGARFLLVGVDTLLLRNAAVALADRFKPAASAASGAAY